jgi:hypothetical protein
MNEHLLQLSQNQEVLFQSMIRLEERLEDMKINQGIGLASINAQKTSHKLFDYEFKIFSQWGEDGIIQHLTRVLEIPNKTFIEFGADDFIESNCRFLQMKDNWSGFVVDGTAASIQKLRNSNFYWRYQIEAVNEFITAENINDLLSRSGFDEDLGLMSVDIDGNDYHVLDAMTVFRPRILICEYNAVFGGDRSISTPYDPEFFRTRKHYSNLYFGASLGAMVHLGRKKGYSLVGTNSIGSNAFFVRDDLMTDKLECLSAADAYFPCNVRESRDPSGRLTYLTGNDRLKLLQGLPVINVETGEVEAL